MKTAGVTYGGFCHISFLLTYLSSSCNIHFGKNALLLSNI